MSLHPMVDSKLGKNKDNTLIFKKFEPLSLQTPVLESVPIIFAHSCVNCIVQKLKAVFCKCLHHHISPENISTDRFAIGSSQSNVDETGITLTGLIFL